MLALAALSATIIAGTALTVHDGDTLRCGAERVRLFGVDAPEVRRGKTASPAGQLHDQILEPLQEHDLPPTAPQAMID